MTWLLDELRFTVFPVSAFKSGEGMWKERVGEEPEQELSRPRDGTFRAEGPFIEDRLLLHIDQSSVHWIYHKNPPEADTEPAELMIGEFPEAARPLKELVGSWLHSCPPLKRIAWGLQLTKLAKSRGHGFEIASEYLKNVKIDRNNSFDFLYQINRRRRSESGVPKLEINRLNSWRVIQRVSGGAKWVAGEAVASHLCSLTLDVNTSHEYLGPFPPDKLEAVQEELFEAACDIAVHGDIP